MAPAMRSSQCMPFCTAPTREASQAAASAQPMLTHRPLKLNSRPSSRKASALFSTAGAMNCGTNARKNNATLGFSAFVQKPRRKIVFKSATTGLAPSSAMAEGARDINMRRPTYSR
jgi:hypothetical protein